MKNQTGFYHFRCWVSPKDKLVGEVLSIFEYQAWVNEGWKVTGFDGRRGTVCIVTNDDRITRENLLSFASQFMQGKLINVAVNLKDLTYSTSPVTPPP